MPRARQIPFEVAGATLLFKKCEPPRHPESTAYYNSAEKGEKLWVTKVHSGSVLLIGSLTCHYTPLSDATHLHDRILPSYEKYSFACKFESNAPRSSNKI